MITTTTTAPHKCRKCKARINPESMKKVFTVKNDKDHIIHKYECLKCEKDQAEPVDSFYYRRNNIHLPNMSDWKRRK